MLEQDAVMWDLMANGDGVASAAVCATPSPVMFRPGHHTPSPPYLRLSTALHEGSPAVDGVEAWTPTADLDVFFTQLYTLYFERGFPVFATRRITSLVMMGFTVVFVGVLAVCVDWSALMACAAHNTCQGLFAYTVDPVGVRSSWRFTVFAGLLLFGVYWVWTLAALVPALRAAWRAHVFYRDCLGIPTRDLQTMQWRDVVARFNAVHATAERRLVLTDDGDGSVSAQYVAMRILRKDNYLVAMMNRDVINMTVAVPWLGKRRVPFTKCFEWNLRVSLLDWMIGPDFMLRVGVQSVRTLQWRFRALGALSLVVLPFVLPFLALYFAFRHVEEFQAKKEYLGPRKWSPRAHWVLREFNELPHVQLRRMSGSLDAANLYCRQFPSHLLAAVAKCVSYVCGAVVSVCLGLALVDDDLLVTVTVGDKNLLWVTAVCTAVLATARAFVFDPEERMLNPNGAMALLVPFTHYMPSKWRGRCHTYDVQEQFQTLFPYRAKLFVQEILGAVLAPWTFGYLMPREARTIAHFLQAVTVVVPRLGAVCVYSTFDPRLCCQAGLGAAGSKYGLDFPVELFAGPMAVCNVRAPKCRQGKLEKSMLSFFADNEETGWMSPTTAAAVKHMAARTAEFLPKVSRVGNTGGLGEGVAVGVLDTTTEEFFRGLDLLRSSVVAPAAGRPDV